MRYQGKLAEYYSDRGYGYLKCPEFKTKVFIHISDVDTKELSPGVQLEFEVIFQEKGPKAIKAKNLAHQISNKLKLTGCQAPVTLPEEKAPREPAKVETVLTMPRSTVPKRSLHLYMPWNPGYIHDQMYQLRNKMEQHSYSWIPKINSTKNKDPFKREIIEVLELQLKQGVESCLYMTNFNCIHVWKISQIHYAPTLPEEEKIKTLADYAKHDVEFWIQVSDVYVLQADHDGKLTPILQELEKLSLCSDYHDPCYNAGAKITPYMSAQRYPAPVTRNDEMIFFPGVAITNGTETKREKWLNTHRKVTKEYNLMNEHMRKNVYTDMWGKFNNRTQHFLIEMEMLKIESAGYNSLQSLQFCKQKFECYVSALLNEFEDLIAQRLLKIAGKLKLQRIDGKDYDTLEILEGNAHISPDLNFYRNIITDSIWRVNLENLRMKHHGEISADLSEIVTLTRNNQLLTKVNALTSFRNWFAHDYFYVISQFQQGSSNGEEVSLIAKINNILNLISSPYSSNNVFTDIYAHKSKNSKSIHSADFKELVSELKSLSRKAA
jgi:cold shock CspA family protein